MNDRPPSYVGIDKTSFDWFGWIMTIASAVLLFFAVSATEEWYMKIVRGAIPFLFFMEYGMRLFFGRIKLVMYHDTIIYKMYEIQIGMKTIYVCASNEDELDLYMEFRYPEKRYKVLGEHNVESFIKETITNKL